LEWWERLKWKIEDKHNIKLKYISHVFFMYHNSSIIKSACPKRPIEVEFKVLFSTVAFQSMSRDYLSEYFSILKNKKW
jgi:hypothetical protein